MIFVDGHGAELLNFTPTPLTAPVVGLIIAVIFGLSTDYEVFLVSRMVEARARGMTHPRRPFATGQRPLAASSAQPRSFSSWSEGRSPSPTW